MKEIFKFQANKDKEVEVKTQTEEGVLTKKEVQKVPVSVVIKSPSVIEKEQLDEFQAVEWSKLVLSGVLTKQMLSKVYADTGGILSKEDIKRYSELVEKYNTTLLEYQELSINKTKKKEHKEAIEAVSETLEQVYKDIQSYDLAKEELFKNSVETKVREKSIQWLTLFLAYIEEDSKLTPFFEGDTYEEKLKSFYSIKNSEDTFSNLIADKVAFYVSLWFLGRITEKEDFEKLEASINE
jgi:hypothetical protein